MVFMTPEVHLTLVIIDGRIVGYGRIKRDFFLRYTHAKHMLWWLQERTMCETINGCGYKVRVLLCQH